MSFLTSLRRFAVPSLAVLWLSSGCGGSESAGDQASDLESDTYCAAFSEYVDACHSDLTPDCKSKLASACRPVSINLSAAARTSIVACRGKFVCEDDLFNRGGCVDEKLKGVALTPVQESTLRDLCTVSGWPAERCLQHTEDNGPHRIGASVIHASDAAIQKNAAACLELAKAETYDLNRENTFHNCMSDYVFSAVPACE